MPQPKEVLISDLTVATPAAALSAVPVPDRWLVLPYEGEISGKMLWKPARARVEDLTVPLPAMGLCRIYLGLYGSGTVPIWYNFYGPKANTKSWVRLRLRLSDQDWFEEMTPDDYPQEPRLGYISEMPWRTVDLKGQSLVLAPPREEACDDLMTFVAYVRIVPVERAETWPPETKRLTAYFDSNFHGHFVESAADIKRYLMPLRETDVGTVFWTTCREDTCYYPSRVGNPFTYNGTTGVYPYWAGRDLERMLARGEDPLKIVCDVAHGLGLKLFASHRRMTCRMPPFVFPLHPEGMFLKRRDLWCADDQGAPVPHLSLAYPAVRARMIALLAEQAENYDIDGVHLYFSRGTPFVLFEGPVVEEFRKRHGIDPRPLPVDDARVWDVRAHFILTFLRELRAALDAAGAKRNRRLEVAMHVAASVRASRFYGLDVGAMGREGLVDIVLPDHAHFLPAPLPDAKAICATPEQVGEFAAALKGTKVRLMPVCGRGPNYTPDTLTQGQRAAAYYRAGATGLHWYATPVGSRMGHVDELDRVDARATEGRRMVRIKSFDGMRIDMNFGLPTNG
jgi:hypothetical protein